jgi:AraC family transcriptional regulator of adaptative response/methylated-DNA-[protein]-cysteine methyltransferase
MRCELLRPQAGVADAIYGAGYSSSSRFYEESTRRLGMTPTAYKNGGQDIVIRYAIRPCSLGFVLVAQSDKGICAILLGDEPDALTRDLRARFARAELKPGDGDFEQVVATTVAFLEAPRTGFDLPLDLRGTSFQRRVWQALSEIPAGETVTYGELARRIGKPTAARAVAQACGANPLAVAVPCHRALGAGARLSGYRWGTARKRRLIERETE